MLYQQTVRSEIMDTNHIPLLTDDKKALNIPMAPSKPSNFSIDHILNAVGTTREKLILNGNKNTTSELRSLYKGQEDCYLMDNQVNRYPPILDWLQYTRYRPPRLPRPARTGPIKRTPGRLPRIPFTPYQLNELESAYKRANYLSSEDANKLAIHLDLTCVRVKIWFQNRRARERRETRESPNASYSPPKSQLS